MFCPQCGATNADNAAVCVQCGRSLQPGALPPTPLPATGVVIPPGATAFYTCTGVLDDTSPWADVQKVVYYLKPSTYRNAIGKDLVRGTIQTFIQPMPKYSSSILIMMRRVGDCPGQDKSKAL